MARSAVTIFSLSVCLCVFVVKIPGFCLHEVPQKLQTPITSLAFSPDGSKLAVGTYGQVIVYNSMSWQQTAIFRQVSDAVRALAFSPDGKTIAIGSGIPAKDGRVVL